MNYLRGTSSSRFIAEEEIIIGLNDLAAIFSGEIERATAIEIVDQIDASGR